MLLTTVGLLSCDKDSPDTPPAPAKTEMGFVHSVNIGDNTYVSVFKDMNVGSLNTDNALVMPKGAFSFVYKGKVYITDTEHIYKYAQKEGKLVQEGNTILLPSGAAAMYITFASDHKAYVSCSGLGKVIIIILPQWRRLERLTWRSIPWGKPLVTIIQSLPHLS